MWRRTTSCLTCPSGRTSAWASPTPTTGRWNGPPRAANCHEFIAALPKGYDTLAGDAGDLLSGGERQRITIARAMLKPASAIILDEATAYAEPESEAQIQEAISRLVREKALIVVAHRLSTIRNANQILVIDGGRLIGRGKHPDLLEGCPLYRKLWEQHISAADSADETEAM